DLFAAKRAALLAQHPRPPFWSGGNSYDPEFWKAMRAMQREQNDLLKQILGPVALFATEEMLGNYRRQYGDLPMEKIERLVQLRMDYSEMQSAIYNEANGSLLPEDRARIALLEKEQRADLAKLLSPAELEDYDLRSSPTASSLRSKLTAFKPTEEEFRAIFKVQQAMDEALGGTYARSIADLDVRKAKQAEADKEVERVLAPERYAQYRLATDSMYSSLGKIVARFDLPFQAAVDVAALQKETTQRVAAINRDPSLTPAQRVPQLAALGRAAEAAVVEKLGKRGYEAYRENGGFWLQGLVRAPQPLPKK
ncbi:MAG TPA: hypothetical protein VM029_16680, partial [Opitutaceae bacterium]|nr:hypothetical protein [Opitutaceae bacterium]